MGTYAPFGGSSIWAVLTPWPFCSPSTGPSLLCTSHRPRPILYSRLSRRYSSLQKERVSIKLILLKRSLPRGPCLSSSPSPSSSSSSSSCPPPHPSRYSHSSLPLLLGMTEVVTPTSLVVSTRSTTNEAVRDLPSHGQGACKRESSICRWVPSSSAGSAFTYSLVLRPLSAAYFEPTPSSFIDFPRYDKRR